MTDEHLLELMIEGKFYLNLFLLKMLICFFNKLFGPVFGVFWSNSSISLGPLADFYSYTKHIKKEFDPKWW